MITKEKYDLIKNMYGEVASFAVWDRTNNSLKRNGVTTMAWRMDSFQTANLSNVLLELKTKIVILGYNVS